MTFNELASRFDHVKEGTPNKGKGIVRQASCRCPVHDDRTNSCELAEFSNGNLGVFCQACGKDKTADILASVGLKMGDLFANDSRSEKRTERYIEAEYEYHDCPDAERLVKVKYRYADGHKEFRWKQRKAGRWIWNAQNVRIPLYGIRSAKDAQTVFLVEGEKDVDTLIGFGYAALSLPHGAKTEITWQNFYDEAFRNRDVYIVPDHDQVGESYALLQAKMIRGTAKSVYILDLATVWPEIPNHGDLTDMVTALGEEEAVRRLYSLCNSAKPWEGDSPNNDALEQFKPILVALKREKPEEEQELSDQFMGRLFARIFGRELRFNVTAKEWYFFNGRFWQIDTGGMIAAKKAKLLTDALLFYSTQASNREFAKFVVRYGSLRCRKTMLEDARSECFVSNADFDRDGRFFNCQNGELDLNTFQFLPHEPAHLISKISNVIYDPNAVSKDWIKVIDDVMQGNQNKIVYLQKVLGITLTADTALEKLWLLYGPTTRNGKSTVTETMAYMHGGSAGYALMMSPETLAQRKTKDSRQASGDIARLAGCRFLNASEPPKRMLFDSALLKLLTGRDTIVARHLMEREFEFMPQFKLLINTNHLPRIQDDTLFESERIVVIPFDRHFGEEEQDPGLKDRLKSPENISGIFNWCLDGLRLYRETGLSAPDEMKVATEKYRETSDKIALFIADELEKTGKNSAAGEVYQRFASWCDSGGYGVESKRNFFDEMKAKGIFLDHGTVNGVTVRNVIRGYELISL